MQSLVLKGLCARACNLGKRTYPKNANFVLSSGSLSDKLSYRLKLRTSLHRDMHDEIMWAGLGKSEGKNDDLPNGWPGLLKTAQP